MCKFRQNYRTDKHKNIKAHKLKENHKVYHQDSTHRKIFGHKYVK